MVLYQSGAPEQLFFLQNDQALALEFCLTASHSASEEQLGK
jgi:hypothetical protein